MKKISEHLGQIIVALACVALLISAVTLFSAPIGDFFESIVEKETAVGGEVMTGIENIDVSDIGVGESVGGNNGPAEVPDNIEFFYTYALNNDETGYKVSLNTNFKEALDGNTDYVVDGETLWTVGSALPNPGSTYSEIPVTDMSGMFRFCQNLMSLDVSGFDTSNVTDMSGMFSFCQNLMSLDVSGFDTSNVTNMNGMFGWCNSLISLDVSGFDTSNVTNMNGMFYMCQSLISLDVLSFDTSKVTDMSGMFGWCSSLISLDLSSFDTSKVTDMSDVFDLSNNLASITVRTEADKTNFLLSLSVPKSCTVSVK